MPAIPTLLASKDISTGATSPLASPDSFSPSFGAVAGGLQDLGQGLQQMSNVEYAISHRKAQQRDSRWSTESLTQERMHLSEWMADPKNNSDEEFASKFQEYAQSRIQVYDQSAPSPEAAEHFRSNMMDWSSRQYSVALHETEKTRLNNSITSIDNSISDTLKSFRDAQKVPGMDALGDLEDNFRLLHDSIEQQFGEISPATANKLQEHLIKQAVMGIAPTHPEDAKRILDGSNIVGEETRKTLLNQIEQSTRSRDIVAEDQFSRARKDHLAAVFFGKTADKMPTKVYELYYDKDKAAVYKAHDDEVIDTYNTANKFIADVTGFNPAAQVQALDTFIQGASTAQDREVMEILQPKIRQNLQQLQRDRVGWLVQNNPHVEAVQQKVEIATTPEEQASLLNQRNSLVLQFQGPAPQEATEKERGYYLNLPSHDRHILSTSEATAQAAQINQVSPAEAVKAISSIVSRYPDPYHQSVVFNDLVKAEGGIKQEYQLAFQNRGAWWLDTYISAIANTKGIAALDETKRNDIFAEVEKSPRWKQFQVAMLGDNFERAKEIEGFKSGIASYTQALVMSGKPLKEAAATAVDMLIGESLGFATVNGQPIAVAKERPNGVKRSDAEVQDLGRRLGVALKHVDPRQIQQANFPGLQALGGEDRVERQQAMRNIVTARGFFVVGNDGQSASLHLRDDKGIPFEVTDKSGNPFSINFEDLPEFTYMGYGQVIGTGRYNPIPPKQGPLKELPQSTYELRKGGGLLDRMFGSGQVQTNWPVVVPWIQNSRRMPNFVPPSQPVLPIE